MLPASGFVVLLPASGLVVLLPEPGLVVLLPLSGDVGEPERDVPLVPVGLGRALPLVPAPVREPVVLPAPVRVRLVRDRVDRDADPRRAFEEAHGCPAEFSFAAIDPSAVVPVRFALPVALALPEVEPFALAEVEPLTLPLPEYVPFALVLPFALALPAALLFSPVVAVPDAVVPLRRLRADVRPVVADGTHGDAFGDAFAAPAGVPCVEPGCCVVR